MSATALSAVTTPLAGHLSDRFGRKRMYIIGISAIGVFVFVYFALLNTAIPVVIFVAIILSFIPHDMAYGPQAALIAECFPARLRYSGSSLGFHLASIIAGGPAPLIATALLAWTGSGYSVALYVLLSCVISIVATIPLPDYTKHDIEDGCKVAGRGLDDLQYLRGRGLLLQRFARLSQEPRIFHRDDRLRGEVLQQRDLLVGKCADFLTVDNERPEERVIPSQRHGKHRTPTAQLYKCSTNRITGSVGIVVRDICYLQHGFAAP